MERRIQAKSSSRASRMKPRRALSLVVAVTFFCSLTACTTIEWKHFSRQYTGDLNQDLEECNEFKRTRKLHFEEPPYDTGEPQRLEKLNAIHSAEVNDRNQVLGNSLLLSSDQEKLLRHCMDYKGYRGKATAKALGVVVTTVAVIGLLGVVNYMKQELRWIL